MTRVSAADPLVFLGQEQEGFLLVQSSEGMSWVMKVLVQVP